MVEHEQPSPGKPVTPDGMGQVAGGWPGQPDSFPPPAGPADLRRPGRPLTGRAAGWVVAGALACAVVGLSVALATTTSPTGVRTALGTTAPGRVAPAFPGRSGYGGGGFRGGFGFGGAVLGTVESVARSGFTMTTRAGEKLTVKEQSSTTFREGSTSASAGAIADGDTVAVIGTESGSTIKAAQVVVLPAGSGFYGPFSGGTGA